MESLQNRVAALEKKIISEIESRQIQGDSNVLKSLFEKQENRKQEESPSNANNIRPSICVNLWGGPIMPASDQNLW